MQRNICPHCQRPSYTSEGRGRVTICPYCGAHFLTGFDDERIASAHERPEAAASDAERAPKSL